MQLDHTTAVITTTAASTTRVHASILLTVPRGSGRKRARQRSERKRENMRRKQQAGQMQLDHTSIVTTTTATSTKRVHASTPSTRSPGAAGGKGRSSATKERKSSRRKHLNVETSRDTVRRPRSSTGARWSCQQSLTLPRVGPRKERSFERRKKKRVSSRSGKPSSSSSGQEPNCSSTLPIAPQQRTRRGATQRHRPPAGCFFFPEA